VEIVRQFSADFFGKSAAIEGENFAVGGNGLPVLRGSGTQKSRCDLS
jgi:hypothetical protein